MWQKIMRKRGKVKHMEHSGESLCPPSSTAISLSFSPPSLFGPQPSSTYFLPQWLFQWGSRKGGGGSGKENRCRNKKIKSPGSWGVSWVLLGPSTPMHSLPSLGSKSWPLKRGWSIPDGSRCSKLRGDAFLCHQAFGSEIQGDYECDQSQGRKDLRCFLTWCQLFPHTRVFENQEGKQLPIPCLTGGTTSGYVDMC